MFDFQNELTWKTVHQKDSAIDASHHNHVSMMKNSFKSGFI